MSYIVEYHSDRGAVGWHVTDPATGTVAVSTAVLTGSPDDDRGVLADRWKITGQHLWMGPGPRRAAWSSNARYLTTARDTALNILMDQPRNGAVQRTMSRPNVLALTA